MADTDETINELRQIRILLEEIRDMERRQMETYADAVEQSSRIHGQAARTRNVMMVLLVGFMLWVIARSAGWL